MAENMHLDHGVIKTKHNTFSGIETGKKFYTII
jgi:hypothetical protein